MDYGEEENLHNQTGEMDDYILGNKHVSKETVNLLKNNTRKDSYRF